jgi:hypothetical protein
VVERRRLPRRHRVARLTTLTEVARHVIRVRRSGEVCSVAIDTVRRQRCILVAGVTDVAGNRSVRTGQRKSCGGMREG